MQVQRIALTDRLDVALENGDLKMERALKMLIAQLEFQFNDGPTCKGTHDQARNSGSSSTHHRLLALHGADCKTNMGFHCLLTLTIEARS